MQPKRVKLPRRGSHGLSTGGCPTRVMSTPHSTGPDSIASSRLSKIKVVQHENDPHKKPLHGDAKLLMPKGRASH